ncbi:molybdopterin molybdotransferase MoeA [soil metagenome]
MLPVAEARRRVLEAFAPLAPTEVLVRDALGLVAAETLRAPHALPRFANSAMDGYALRGADAADATEATPVTLEVTGEIRAGDPGDLEVSAGTAVRIMTGAPLPPGADAIAPIEVAQEDEGRVTIVAPTPSGKHVRPAGDDLGEGDVLVEAGQELGPGELALLASMGMSPLRVRGAPKVAVLVTGDELVAPEATPGAGQIRDSNSIALTALVKEAGGEVISAGSVADTYESTEEAFRRAAELSDLVMSSGGVAVGRYDFVKDVVTNLGRIDLWRVAMQPGKPVVLGAIGGKPFLGLPGNPVSIHVGFEQFVRPAIRKLRGCANLLRPRIEATLTETITKPAGRLHFVRVRLSVGRAGGSNMGRAGGSNRRAGAGGSGFSATPTGPQGSHIQSSLINCHGVALFERDKSRLEAGSTVTVEVWRLPEEP